jgi:hypothetical protein
MRSIVALALVAVSIGAAVPVMAQGVPAEMPTAEEAPAAPPASAIPKPAAESKPAKKTAKKKVSCDGLFEAACKETEGCSWSGGLAKADGSPPKGDCAKVDKTASKGSKTSCPTMFEALCKETSGCAWTPGAPGEDGKPVPGSCAFAGKASKAAPAKKAAAAAPSPAPDAFTDQQEK